MSGRIPNLKGNPLSIFELLLLLMINCSKGGLNDVEVAIFVDVSMDDAGLADPGMPDNHDLDLLALHRICSRNDVIIYIKEKGVGNDKICSTDLRVEESLLDIYLIQKYNGRMEEGKAQSVYIWGLFNGKEFTVPTKVK